MSSLLCKFFIGAAVGKNSGGYGPCLCVSLCKCAGADCVCLCLSSEFTNRKKEPSFLLQPHITVRLKAYFVTCMRVLRKELDTGASSGEVTDCVIVSKLNNQYSSACWDNIIIHLSIVEDYRQRDISHCLLPKCPTLEILCQNCWKGRAV